MSIRWLPCLLLSTLAFGQAAAPPAQKTPSAKAPVTQVAPKAAAPQAAPKAPAAAPSAEVSPNTPVITLNGVCETKAGQAKPAAECKTVLTRAEFERILSMNPQAAQMAPQVRQQMASRVAQLMIIAHEAEKQGVQNRPETKELIRFAIMNAEAQELARMLQERYAHSTPEEVQKYYDANKSQFEVANLKRLIIPKPRPPEGKPPVDEAAFKASAEKIQQAAAAGGDFEKLQKDAFEAAEIKAAPPSTAVNGAKLAEMPGDHKVAFALKPGEVSQLISDPNAYYVYKLESKETVSLEKAKPEIEKQLQSEKIEKAAQEITGSVKPVFNPAYFGPIAEAAPGQARMPAATRPATAAPKTPTVETKAPAPPPKQ